MMRRLRCLFRHHLWQPDAGDRWVSNGRDRWVCSRCGAHVSAITDAHRRFEGPAQWGRWLRRGRCLPTGPVVVAVMVAVVAPESWRLPRSGFEGWHRPKFDLTIVAPVLAAHGLIEDQITARRTLSPDSVPVMNEAVHGTSARWHARCHSPSASGRTATDSEPGDTPGRTCCCQLRCVNSCWMRSMRASHFGRCSATSA